MRNLDMEGWVLSLVDGCAVFFLVVETFLFLLGEGAGFLVTEWVTGLIILTV